MSGLVDAYQRWLGIPAADCASGGPNHYRLLGLKLLESDRAAIDTAAKRLMGSLQPHLAGPNQATVRKLLDEISEARRCLMLNDRKTAYDQKIRGSSEAVRQTQRPVPSESVPEAIPLPLGELEAAPEANPIDDPDDVPEAEPFDEIDDPTAVEQTFGAASKQAPNAATAPSGTPAEEDAGAADASGWEAAAAETASGDSGGSFFSGIGLSSTRAPAAQTSVAADTLAGSGSAGSAMSASTGPKSAAGRSHSGGMSIAKRPPRRGPETWHIIAGVGGSVVLLILAVVAFNSASQPASSEGRHRQNNVADSEPPRIEFGPHAVVGRIHDRTVLSPVTGPSAAVPIERHGDLFLADVKINDQDVGKFLLDTGTSNLIISKAVADKLKLPSRRTKNLKTPGGMQEATERKIDSLTMGPVRFEEAMILPEPTNDEWLALGIDIKPWADAIHLPIVGVIGGEIWSQVPFSIDPDKNVVTFYKRGPFPFSAGEKAEFLTRFDNFLKPAMPASVDGGPEGTFLLATGAPHDLMLNGSAARLKTLTLLGEAIPNPTTVESIDGDGYFDGDVRQSGVIGAGILSHYLLMFDYAGERFMAVRIKK